jgi:Kef-type K+ transport system membrane component KefB
MRARISLRAALLALLVTALLAQPAWAASSPYGATFLWIAVILVAARLAGVVERIGMPAVLGELLVGVVIGNLSLLGFTQFEAVQNDQFIAFLAQLGVVILLFQVGLETQLAELARVGARATAVAVLGVVAPFLLGTFVVGPWLLPGLSFHAYLFLGATLTATSVGITGRVFRDMNVLQSSAARVVLGAAVIDDVIGIVILAVVSNLVTQGNVSLAQVGWLIGQALLFLAGAIVIGRALARPLARAMARIHGGTGMQLTLVIALGLFLAWLANAIGLAPIIGAFAAGLLLEPAFLEDFEHPEVVAELEPFAAALPAAQRPQFDAVLARQRQHHHQALVEPLGLFLVPMFFVYTGMQVDLATLADLNLVLVALALTLAAFVGKIVSGLAATRADRWIVGWGMAPRGEVGLIFAVVGKELDVIDDRMFSVILVMVILTTLLTPPVLAHLLRGRGQADAEAR